jgi:uncharacterized protein
MARERAELAARIAWGPGVADITIQQSPERGRGVFAARQFEAGETIEICPVIVLSEADARKLDDTGLYNYYFGWGQDGVAAAIALGCGSLYNHSEAPNAAYQKDFADRTVAFFAITDIAPGQEIFVKYNPGPAAEDGKVWFDVR